MDTTKQLLKAGTLLCTGALLYKCFSASKETEFPLPPCKINRKQTDEIQVHLIGGGLASLAAAAYLIQDCNIPGKNINIYEGQKILGGSNDGTGNPSDGFVYRGECMLNEYTYENFWELLHTIPSINMPGMSLTEEILNFDHLHPTYAQARLIDKNGTILDVSKLGFNALDRIAFALLLLTPEQCIEKMTIMDWFQHTPHFFKTNFWCMWQTTFAFQTWSSLIEFKRYMNRMLFEFPRIETLEGVTRTPYNQYESIIVPIVTYLKRYNVHFIKDTVVTDLDFKEGTDPTVEAIHVKKENKKEHVIKLQSKDLCIMTNGCITDCSTLGDWNTKASYQPEHPLSATLWEKITSKKAGLGNPQPFFHHPEQTNWESFTVTMKGNKLLKIMEQYTHNIPGSGGLMTFKDSNWLMSIVVPAQPHFKSQPMDTTVLWGYGLYTNRPGNYSKKPMLECTGKEIFTELLYHLHLEDEMDELSQTVVNVIPCMMPYINSLFQPRKKQDRPAVVPAASTNFAMISQFVEVPKDIVFTEEYSVRAARIAVYTLMNVKKKTICPVTPYNQIPKVLFSSIKAVFH